jgi:ribosome-associated protein YbcJ (S4-like RNA binding protein)
MASNKTKGSANRRMTENDEDRKSRGKEVAAEKGLKWTKNVPKGKEYEYVKRDDSHLAVKEVGFLDIGEAEPTHAYDIGGEWKLLYKKPGDDRSDKPVGPGISPRTSPKPNKKKAPLPMKIYVRNWDGLNFTLDDVKPEDTIDDIQNRIEDEHHIPREHQRLRLGNQPLNNPDKTLKESRIEDRTTLDLDPMEISVREPYSNKKHTLIVEPTETIEEVKGKVEDKTGIPKKDQILTYNNRPLDNNRKTLEDYGIQHQDTLDLEPMIIKVRAPDGRAIDLMVDPEDTIDDIKKQVQKKLGISPKDQRPTFDGKPLPDNSTLDDNDIHHGDVIDLQPMIIKVRAPDGRTCDLNVNPGDTIPKIKKQVKKQLGIPTKEQRPVFNGNPLPDNSTLEDNDINHGDVIDLQPMQIKVRAPDGRTCDLNVNPEDTIPDIKKQVEKKIGIPTKEQRPTFKNKSLPNDSTLKDNGICHGDVIDLQPMKIRVRSPDGRTCELNVNPDDTIPDIKKQVKKHLGIPTKEQRPTFKNKPLPNDSTLDDNSIRHGDVIDLQPMQIKVRGPDGRTCDLNVNPEDTIPDIKKQVEKKLGIPTEEQRPVFNDEPLPDNSTLEDNGICHGDVIDLEPMQINVKAPDGRTTQLLVTPEDTVKDIKKRVKKKFGIPTGDQRPRFNGNPLPDGSTLRDNDIEHGDTIDLDPMEIKVRAPDGRITELLVNPDDTIDQIKKRVKKNLGIAREDQRPEFNGKPLPNDSTLRDNKIRHGDTIDLQPMEIKVKTSDGRIANLEVDPEDTIDDVKDQVRHQLGIAPEDQRPTFKGKKLPDKSTLKDNDIHHGDVINLEPMEIQVKAPNGRVVDLVVNPYDTIDDVKKQVEKQLGIPTEDQRPVFNDKPLSDESTLKDNKIRHGDVIDLQPMEIYVIDLDGKKGTYEVAASDSIKDIKSQVEDKTGVDREAQRLLFEDVLLEEDNTTLNDVGIKHQDTLQLQPWRVHVRLPGGKKITLDVNPKTTTPHDVKNMLKKREGFMPSKQTLKHKGKDLDDPSSLEDNGVQHDDVIDLRLAPPPLKLEASPKRDLKKALDPDRYGKVTVTTYKTRYDGEPGESFIDGEIKREVTDFKFEKAILRSHE